MKFFLDNNLSPRLARALNELVGPDHHVVHLRDKFTQSITDVEWIQSLSKEGDWVVVTRDDAINRKPHEREAMRRSKLTVFFLAVGWKHEPFWKISWQLVRWWPDIMQQAEMVTSGGAFVVPFRHSGKFRQV